MQIGPLYVDRDSIRLFGFSVHVEHPWSECVRDYNAPARIYLHSPVGSLTIGLLSRRTWVFDDPPGTARRGKVPWHLVTSQSWHPLRGSTMDWKWITFHPTRSLTCRKSIGLRSTCGKVRWHPGSCRELSEWEREAARRRSASPGRKRRTAHPSTGDS